MGIHVFCNNFKKYFQISQKKYIGLFCLPKIIGRGKGDGTLIGMNTPSKKYSNCIHYLMLALPLNHKTLRKCLFIVVKK